MKKNKLNSDDLHREIAHAAARLLIEGFAESFAEAKQKAAAELGLTAARQLPSNLEVQTALAENLNLFEGDEWRNRVREMRIAVAKAMHFFRDFDPHLVGSVYYGTATAYSSIGVHLYCDELEQVTRYLGASRIPYRLTETMLTPQSSKPVAFPSLQIVMGEFDYEIVVLPARYRIHPPLSPLDGKPYQRANSKQLQKMIDNDVLLNGRAFSDGIRIT